MDVENEKDWRCGDGWYSLEMRSEGGGRICGVVTIIKKKCNVVTMDSFLDSYSRDGN